MAHANARLGPAGRRELVRLMIELGMPERRAAARSFGLAVHCASVEAALVGGR
jgi:hypothetical protein